MKGDFKPLQPPGKFKAQNTNIPKPPPTEEESFLHLVTQVLHYTESKKACPLAVPASIVERINPKYNCIGLHDIGGEGIIIRAVDTSNLGHALKVALPHAQAIGNRRVGIWDKVMFKGMPVDQNSYKMRYYEGGEIQIKLYRSLVRDAFAALSVPMVYVNNLSPLYIDMEWVESISILDYLKPRKSLKFSLEMFCKLLECMEYVHGEGIVHRDIKAGNIMIGRNDNLVIIDWTMSKDLRSNRDLTYMISAGTHLSPKIANQHFKDFSIADEIVSLGFTMLEFFHGNPLPRCFSKKEIVESKSATLLRKYTAYRAELAETLVDRGLRDVFLKATDPTEKYRYELVSDFRVALLHAMKGTTMSLPTVTAEVIDEIHQRTIFAEGDGQKTTRSDVITHYGIEDIRDTLRQFQEEQCELCGANCSEKICHKIDERVIKLILHLREENLL